jgi:hypothetical protein
VVGEVVLHLQQAGVHQQQLTQLGVLEPLVLDGVVLLVVLQIGAQPQGVVGVVVPQAQAGEVLALLLVQPGDLLHPLEVGELLQQLNPKEKLKRHLLLKMFMLKSPYFFNLEILEMLKI